VPRAPAPATDNGAAKSLESPPPGRVTSGSEYLAYMSRALRRRSTGRPEAHASDPHFGSGDRAFISRRTCMKNSLVGSSDLDLEPRTLGHFLHGETSLIGG
jgi:hypothetical protein